MVGPKNNYKNAFGNDFKMVNIKKISFKRPEAQKDPKTEPKKTQKSILKRMPKWLKLSFLGVLIALVLVVAPAVVAAPGLISSGKKVQNSMQTALNAVNSQDLVKAGEELKKTEENLKNLESKLKILSVYQVIPGLRLYYQDAQNGLTAALESVKAGEKILGAVNPYADVLGLKGEGTFTGGTTEDRLVKIVQTIGKITPEVGQAVANLDAARVAMTKIDPKRYPNTFRGVEVRAQIESAKKRLISASETMNNLQPALEVLPQILGHPDKRQYLVIFQNDTEKRPTGGFMTAYTVLEVDSGKITAGRSEDIYTLDNKFKKRLEAPEPIKKYHKNVSYFYLRDMNLSPDFKESMALFRQYYDEIPGETEVDGVVTVDTKVLTRLVELLGPIEVPGYGTYTAENDERCNCPNVIYQLELIADEPTHYVKENRKGVLGPLMQQIMAKSLGAGMETFPQLFSTAWRALEQKNILLYFDNPEEQAAAEAIGFAGRIKPVTDGDYFFLVDTNFGGAKSDLYIEQSVTQDIEVKKDGSVEKTVIVEYKNPEPPDNCNLERKSGLCLNGLYRDWVRVYVPEGSELIEVLGSEVPANSYSEAGKTVFEAFYGDESPLRPLGKSKLVFRYRLPFKVEDNYSLYVQKQPGSKPFEYLINLNGYSQSFLLNEDQRLEFEI